LAITIDDACADHWDIIPTDVSGWTATWIRMVTATTLLPAAPRATITPAVVVTTTPHRHTPTPRASTSEAHISTDVAIIILALADITSTTGNVTCIE